MKQVGTSAAALILLSLVGAACATAPRGNAPAEALPLSALAGQWDGTWSGGPARGDLFVTTALNNGVLGGRLRATGTQTFGSDEKALEAIRVSGRTLSFTAQGDGGPFDATLELSPDGKTLYGTGNYRGFTYEVRLYRK